ncbi:class E sortase [Streptomyces sp. LX-29]|uniref:class E sortase n=1 Tax=Streptomyces sp. LX-29 TaxID=2900152 RepID=UPI00240D03D4|nr:class E sortase [Streptomyces sp. LX-29]WFB08494.1 class E sortase [Streptomyces sp. LX-29]
MTALRPEREGAPHGAPRPVPYPPDVPDVRGGYEDEDAAFVAAVEGLEDPLNDPLPTAEPPGTAPDAATTSGVGYGSYASLQVAQPLRDDETMMLRVADVTDVVAAGRTPPPADATAVLRRIEAEPADPRPTDPEPADPRPAAPKPATPKSPASRPSSAGAPTEPAAEDGTTVLRRVEPESAAEATTVLRRVESEPPRGAGEERAASPKAAGPVAEGRAARRRAAQEAARRGRRGRGPRGTPEAAPRPRGRAETAGAGPPRTRMEARQAARARRAGPGVIISRLVGELFITVGVLMLLFVTYQLWWSNIRAHQLANGAANNLHEKWDRGDRDPGVFSPGEGFAIIYIPKLDVKAPIAEGIDKHKVLDRGMVGHYADGRLKTAMPWDEKGNFAVAGHRNTHGEPFRYINRLRPGDKIVVETQRAFFTYEMRSILPQTPPSNTGVIDPVPAGSGFRSPGRYITLTTCTPEFTSTYRMIVWGKMVDERPRSEGKPDALVG